MNGSGRPVALSVAALDSGYARVLEVIDELAAADPTWSFAVVVYADGRVVADVARDDAFRGFVQPVASVSKGLAALTVALLIERGALDPDRPVAQYWPEFAASGKESITVAEMLSHRAGLLDFSPRLGFADVTAREGAADLARRSPAWTRGAGHGYHAFTVGTLVDELLRRVAGAATWEVFDAEFTRGRSIDFWLRLPPEQRQRVRRAGTDAVGTQAPVTGSLTDKANSPFLLIDDDPFWLNSPALWAAGVSSVSGVGSARGIADAYAAAIGADGGDALLSPVTVARVAQMQVAGHDLVLGRHTRYGLGFQKPSPDLDFGTADAFGHDGAGGCLGFADPGTGVAFGYVTEAVPSPMGGDARAFRIAQLVRSIALALRTRNGAA